MSRSRSRSHSPKPKPEKITEPSEEEANKGNCLYVRGLENHLNDDDVKEGFEKFGEIVSVNCTMNPELHINRGFAFVQFKEVEDAKKAMEEMNGKEFHGRTLTVELSKRSKPYSPTPGVYLGPNKVRRGRFDPRDDRYGRRDSRDYKRRYDRRDDRRDNRYRRSSRSRSRSRSRSYSRSRSRGRRNDDRYYGSSRRSHHSNDRYDSRRDRRDDRYEGRRSYH